jgi:hypothetical protein
MSQYKRILLKCDNCGKTIVLLKELNSYKLNGKFLIACPGFYCSDECIEMAVSKNIIDDCMEKKYIEETFTDSELIKIVVVSMRKYPDMKLTLKLLYKFIEADNTNSKFYLFLYYLLKKLYQKVKNSERKFELYEELEKCKIELEKLSISVEKLSNSNYSRSLKI